MSAVLNRPRGRQELTGEDAAAAKELVRLLALGLEWRLDHLYVIVDKNGREVPFVMNEDQRDFVQNMHTRNVIIKARQRGFSTLLQLIQLDQGLFNANHTGVTIADTLPNAGNLFAKIEYAQARLMPILKQAIAIKTQAAKTGMEWEHDSKVYVTTSSRGGTVQLLHVSELGKIARRYPERAKEIVAGSFESVPIDGTIVVESTTEGAFGALYDIAWPAHLRQLAGLAETRLDWRLHFYPWYRSPEYSLTPEEAASVVLNDIDVAYFAKHEAARYADLPGGAFTLGQKAWYVKKRDEKGRAMLREYPTTIQEAFDAAIEGAIFGEEMTRIRQLGRICDIPLDPAYPVHTFWDFGTGNRMVTWLMQRILMQNRWVKYFEADGTGMKAYWRKLEQWRMDNGEFAWGTHHLPHDADTERLGEGIDTYQRILVAGGMRNEYVVPRVVFKSIGIDKMREALPLDNWFDRAGTEQGVKGLDGYQWTWSDKISNWTGEPLGNWASHPADGWMQYAQDFQPSNEKADKSLRNFKNRERRGL